MPTRPGSAAAHPFSRLGSQDRGQGAWAGGSSPAPAPSCRPVERAVMFERLSGRVCRRGGVFLPLPGAGQDRRLPFVVVLLLLFFLPARFRGGRRPFSLFFFFSSTSWRKKLCRTHITQERPFEPSKAPARDGRRSFPGEPEPGGHIPGQQQREIPPRQAKP